MALPTSLKPGIAFSVDFETVDQSALRSVLLCPNDVWEHAIPSDGVIARATCIGRRLIDDAPCYVFVDNEDHAFYAQTEAFLGPVEAPQWEHVTPFGTFDTWEAAAERCEKADLDPTICVASRRR